MLMSTTLLTTHSSTPSDTLFLLVIVRVVGTQMTLVAALADPILDLVDQVQAQEIAERPTRTTIWDTNHLALLVEDHTPTQPLVPPYRLDSTTTLS